MVGGTIFLERSTTAADRQEILLSRVLVLNLSGGKKSVQNTGATFVLDTAFVLIDGHPH
jgi:hypothetical protein